MKWNITTPTDPGRVVFKSEGGGAREALELFAEMRDIDGHVIHDGSYRVALITKSGMAYYASPRR